MAFKDYSTTPSANTTLGDGTYIGPNMLRNKVRRALQQLAADGKDLADDVAEIVTSVATVTSQAIEAAQSVVDAQVFTVTSASGQTVSTRTLLAGITSPVVGQTAYLSEPGREGWWKAIATDAAAVASDTYQGLYVAGSGVTWRRIVEGSTYLASWWGFGAANPTTNHLRIQAAHNLVPEGSVIRLPSEAFNVGGTGSNALTWTKRGLRLTGDRQKTVWTPTHNSNINPISIAAVGFTVDNFTFTGWVTADNSNPRAPIYISDRYASGPVTAISDGVVEDMNFLSCDTGVRVMQQPWGSTGTSIITTPTRIKVRNCYFNDIGYQCVVLGGDDVEVSGCTMNMRAGHSSRPFGYAVRVFGPNNWRIHNNTMHSPDAGNLIGIQTIGVDVVDGSAGATYNRIWDCRNGIVTANIFYGAVLVNDVAETLHITNNEFRHPAGLAGTVQANGYVTFSTDGNPIHPSKQSNILVQGNTGVGFNSLGTMNGHYSNVRVINNEFTGNAYVAGAPELYMFGIVSGASGYPRNFEMRGNRGLGLAANYQFGLRFQGVAGGNYVILDNVVPEGVTNIVVGDGSTGKVMTDFAAGFVNWGSQTAGHNISAPVGAFAAAIANQVSSPRLTF